MANYENIAPYGFDKRSASEVREMAAKGGRKSGETRRKKATLKETLKLLMSLNVEDEEMAELLEKVGLEPNYKSAMCLGLVKSGISGNSAAWDMAARYAGEMPTPDVDEDGQDESIKAFLAAVRPTKDELNTIFEEGVEDGQEQPTAGGV